MRTKLLVTAAIAGMLAMPAMADKPAEGPEKRVDLVEPKPPEPGEPNVKTEDDLDSVLELFSIEEGDIGTRFDPAEFYQQQRVDQNGDDNAATIDQTAGSQGLASIQQNGNNNYATTYQSDSDTPPGAVPFAFPANISVTTQTGDGNVAYVEQWGNAGEKPFANRADIHQFSFDGAPDDANFATVFQQGNDATLATITQGDNDDIGGLFNDANIIQTGNRGSFVGIAQSRDGNSAYVVQSNTGAELDAISSSVSVQQVSDFGGFGFGEANIADIYQHDGISLTTEVLQTNDGTGAGPNAVYIDQTGLFNGIFVEQNGSGNYMDLTQDGLDNVIEANQDGTGNEVELYQDGKGNTFWVHQGGHGNEVLYARQTGELNLVSIAQKGDDNQINDLYQGGFFNTMLLEQLGDDNSIHASQGDAVSFDVISVSQDGNGNYASVSQ